MVSEQITHRWTGFLAFPNSSSLSSLALPALAKLMAVPLTALSGVFADVVGAVTPGVPGVPRLEAASSAIWKTGIYIANSRIGFVTLSTTL